MSVLYCDFCDKLIDTDFHAEHFDDNLNCEVKKEVRREYKRSLRAYNGKKEREYREKNTGWKS